MFHKSLKHNLFFDRVEISFWTWQGFRRNYVGEFDMLKVLSIEIFLTCCYCRLVF